MVHREAVIQGVLEKSVENISGVSNWEEGNESRQETRGCAVILRYRCPVDVLAIAAAYLHYAAPECFNRIIETGVLTRSGLRDTSNPIRIIPGGSFRSRTPFSSNRSVSALVSFTLETREPCSWQPTAARSANLHIILKRYGPGLLVRVLTLVCCLAVRFAHRHRTLLHFSTQKPAHQLYAADSARHTRRGPREVKDDYLPDAVTVGTLDGATLGQTPLSPGCYSRPAHRPGRAPALDL